MSKVVQGSSTWACVCRCRSGLANASRPRIHIFAGEKVCIHAMTPTQLGSAFAASITSRIDSASRRTAFHVTATGSSPDSWSLVATVVDWLATCSRVSGP